MQKSGGAKAPPAPPSARSLIISDTKKSTWYALYLRNYISIIYLHPKTKQKKNQQQMV